MFFFGMWQARQLPPAPVGSWWVCAASARRRRVLRVAADADRVAGGRGQRDPASARRSSACGSWQVAHAIWRAQPPSRKSRASPELIVLPPGLPPRRPAALPGVRVAREQHRVAARAGAIDPARRASASPPARPAARRNALRGAKLGGGRAGRRRARGCRRGRPRSRCRPRRGCARRSGPQLADAVRPARRGSSPSRGGVRRRPRSRGDGALRSAVGVRATSSASAARGSSRSVTVPWYVGAPGPASSSHSASKYGTVLWQKMQVSLQTPPARMPGRSPTSTE